MNSDESDSSVEDRDAASDTTFVSCGVHDTARHGCSAPNFANRCDGLTCDDDEYNADELPRTDAGVHVRAYGLGGIRCHEPKANATLQPQRTGTFKKASIAECVSGVTESMPRDDAFRSTAS